MEQQVAEWVYNVPSNGRHDYYNSQSTGIYSLADEQVFFSIMS